MIKSCETASCTWFQNFRVPENYIGHLPFLNRTPWIFRCQNKLPNICTPSQFFKTKADYIWNTTVYWKLTSTPILEEGGCSIVIFCHTHNCMLQWGTINWLKWTCWAEVFWLLSPYLKPMGSIWLYCKH